MRHKGDLIFALLLGATLVIPGILQPLGLEGLGAYGIVAVLWIATFFEFATRASRKKSNLRPIDELSHGKQITVRYSTGIHPESTASGLE